MSVSGLMIQTLNLLIFLWTAGKPYDKDSPVLKD